MTPARGRLFVRPVETAECLADGRVVLLPETRARVTAQQAEVVAVGEPAWCEAVEDCGRPAEIHGSVADVYAPGHAAATHPVDLRAGDWVLLRARCLQDTDMEGILCCLQDDVLAIVHSEMTK